MPDKNSAGGGPAWLRGRKYYLFARVAATRRASGWGAARSAAPGAPWRRKWWGPGLTSARCRCPPAEHPQPLALLKSPPEVRQPSGIAEFDRVLGGSLVAGSVVLLGGDPGVGKSTLILQVLDRLCREKPPAFTYPGRSPRPSSNSGPTAWGLTSLDLLVATETCLENILKMVEEVRPAFLALDSIQTLYTATLPAAPGSLPQVRETAFRLAQQAKLTGIATFLIGHVTKEGAMAGPMVLEHLVDTVLYLEGDRSHAFRLLRTVKNRFGPTQELGVFEMQEAGLMEVANPSGLFMAERALEVPGAAVVPSLEGSRPILVEVQALVSPSSLALPRRQSMGRRTRAGCRCWWPSWKSGWAWACAARTSSSTWPGGCASPSRPPTWGWPWPWPPRSWKAGAPGHPGLRGSGPHRRGAGGEPPRNPPQGGPQAGVQAGGPGPAPDRAPGGFPGLELLGVETLAEAIRHVLEGR